MRDTFHSFCIRLSPLMASFPRLTFSSDRFDALLCLDGSLPANPDFYSHFSSLPIIAADGAAVQLQHLGITPAYIIGDLDSFHSIAKDTDFPNSSILYVPDQETNDFEKCLIYCQSAGFQSVLVCGFHGGLLEHSLNNWSVYIRYSEILNLCIYESMRYILSIRESLEFQASLQEIISLIPQPEARLTTQGLQWSLTNEWLRLGTREGARNRVIAVPIQIDIHDGSLLFICDARLPYKPIVAHHPNS